MEDISKCEQEFYIQELKFGKNLRILSGVEKAFFAGVSALGIVVGYSMLTKSPDSVTQVGYGIFMTFCGYMTGYHLRHSLNLLQKSEYEKMIQKLLDDLKDKNSKKSFEDWQKLKSKNEKTDISSKKSFNDLIK